MTNRDVAQVRVLELRTKVGARIEEGELGDELATTERGDREKEIVTRQAGAVGEQVEHRHPFAGQGVLHSEIGKVGPHRYVPVEEPVVHEEADESSGEGLGGRADGEDRVGADRDLAGGVGRAETRGEHSFPSVDQAERQTGDGRLVSRLLGEQLDGGSVLGVGAAFLASGPGKQGHENQQVTAARHRAKSTKPSLLEEARSATLSVLASGRPTRPVRRKPPLDGDSQGVHSPWGHLALELLEDPGVVRDSGG